MSRAVARYLSNVSTSPQQIADFYEVYFRSISRFNAETDARHSALCFECERQSGAPNPGMFGPRGIDTHDVAKQMVSHLRNLAVTQFSPPGVPVRIPEGVACISGSLDWNPSGFSPRKIWDELVASMANGRAWHDAYATMADNIVRFFQISPGQPAQVIGGSVVLELGVYWDDAYACHSWSLRAAEELGLLLDCFNAICSWSGPGDETIARDAKFAVSRVRDIRDRIPKGERWKIGREIVIVPFKRKFQFRFGPAFAEQLQLFLSNYAKKFAAAA